MDGFDYPWYEYTPYIIRSNSGGYAIGCYLPPEWIEKAGKIHANERVMKMMIENIKSILKGVKEYPYYLSMKFSEHRFYFEVEGINSCSVYVPYNSSQDVHCHNIDNYKQVSVLHMALSIYLRKMYSYIFLGDEDKWNEMSNLKEDLHYKIKFIKEHQQDFFKL